MCGIAGYIAFEPSARCKTFLEQAANVLAHRGPDGRGAVQLEGGRVGLAIRRLAIVDVAGGTQPVQSQDGGCTMVFNGELYNHVELRSEIASAEKLRSQCDTEVLLALYDERGLSGFDHIRGMFAAAIWDARRKVLVLARDRFGKKPLYYFQDENGLLFGSEIKALLEAEFVPRLICERGLDQFLGWQAAPEPGTVFKGISKLRPGHYLEVDLDGRVQERRYWQLKFNGRALSDGADAPAELRRRLKESVRLRMNADEPVGFLLSGGVDSAAIVALASQIANRPLRTFSIGFEDDGFNEFKYSRAVAKQFGTDHTEVTMDADAYWRILDTVIWHLDEPMSDMAAPALYAICLKAREHVKVLLSGEGSDELLGGYQHRYQRGTEALQGIPALVSGLPERLKVTAGRWAEKLMGRGRLWLLTQPLEYQFLIARLGGWDEQSRSMLFRGGFMERLPRDFSNLLTTTKSDAVTLLQRMLYVDCTVNLPAYLLMKADKMGMAASIEIRCPFLDHEFAEFCAALPDAYKFEVKSGGKLILKEAMKSLLPSELVHRPKMGFPVPMSKWLRGGLRERAEQVLFSRESRIASFLNIAFAEKVWRLHQKGGDHGAKLWQLVLLELWMRKFDVEVPELEMGGASLRGERIESGTLAKHIQDGSQIPVFRLGFRSGVSA